MGKRLSNNLHLSSTIFWKETDFDIASEVMEMDELNRHDCMPSLISLLNHLTKNKISAPPNKVCAEGLTHPYNTFFVWDKDV